ncbi:MAG: hypothetical protein HY762_02975, partial [Planctomycetes bacterium]|nr:hypothetical protein [Planctomycetota bacterium]
MPDFRCLIRLTDVSDSTISATSGAFKIRGDISAVFPTTPDLTLYVGESRTITWTTSGTIPFVKIEYSMNDGSSWVTPPIAESTSNTNSYPWTVPDAITNTVKIRVADAADLSVNGVSMSFKIMGRVLVNQPSDIGLAWVVGTTQKIRWTTTATIPRVKIEWSETDFSTVYSSTEVDCGPAGVYEYDWTIP